MSTSTDADTREESSGGDEQPGVSTRYVKFSQLATEVAGAGENFLDSPPEASVILISHPEGLNLGRRWKLRAGVVMEIGRSGGCDMSLPKAL